MPHCDDSGLILIFERPDGSARIVHSRLVSFCIPQPEFWVCPQFQSTDRLQPRLPSSVLLNTLGEWCSLDLRLPASRLPARRAELTLRGSSLSIMEPTNDQA